MLTIATFLNSTGSTATPDEAGIIKLYSYDATNMQCDEIKEFEFSLLGKSSLKELRTTITDMIEKIDGCKVFVAKEIAGQMYSVLEANKFTIFESDGQPEQFLQSVIEALTENVSPQQPPIATEEKKLFEKINCHGKYYVNIIDAMNADSSLSSKKILLPFLNKKDFSQLDVVCDHIPKWFDEEIKNLGMTLTTAKTGDSQYTATITVM